MPTTTAFYLDDDDDEECDEPIWKLAVFELDA